MFIFYLFDSWVPKQTAKQFTPHPPPTEVVVELFYLRRQKNFFQFFER